MAFAQLVTRGVGLAKFNNLPIPEIGPAPDTALSNSDDIHFGINIETNANPGLYHDFDPVIDKDLLTIFGGLGPRAIEIRRRGGRTAEHDFVYSREPSAAVRGPQGLDEANVDKFNQKLPVKNIKFPTTALYSGNTVKSEFGTRNKGGKGAHPTTKAEYTDMAGGTRWSKTALEDALGRLTGKIHFHLTGMGELAGIFNKSGNYSYNVTSRELRYVRRMYFRFQHKIIFYNGYNSTLKAVMVYPPWVLDWEPDTATNACRICNLSFSRAFPIRWRHHCRLCGRNVCDDCSPHKVVLLHPIRRPDSQAEVGSVRLCTRCHRPNAPSDFT